MAFSLPISYKIDNETSYGVSLLVWGFRKGGLFV
jgi:hypothetical protein